MYTYLLRRVLLLIPTLLIVSVIVFLSVRLIPGDVIDVMFAQMSVSGRANLPSREALEAALGLDRPLHVQYLSWLGDIVLRGDFGDPLMAIEPVAVLIRQRIGVTLELGAMAIVVSLLVSLPVGIYSAVRQDSVADYLARSVAIILVSVPPFWTGTMVMIYPSVWWGWAPPIELNPLVEDPIGHLGHVLLPAVVLGTALAGLSMRMTRTMMLEVLRADYIRTAWSKGLSERLVVIRHAVKNATIPVLTHVAVQLPIVIGGAVIVEEIFQLPGMGRLLVDAVGRRDYPLVSGINVVFAAVVVLVNLLTDVTYSWLDPRVRHE